MSKNIQVIERKIEVREFIDLRKAVGWGIPDTASIEKGLVMSAKGKEEFYKKFGFWQRPNDNFGHGMMQFWKREI